MYLKRFQWPRGLRHGSAVARLLGLWVHFPLGAFMSVCCECCVIRWRFLLRAGHSSGGVLPNVVCLNVIVKPRQWGGPGPLAAVPPRGGGMHLIFWRYKNHNETELMLLIYSSEEDVRLIGDEMCKYFVTY